MGDPVGKYVDHINHNTLDNRKQNLRLVTNAENGQNRKGTHRNSKSGVRGVYWETGKRCWVARITMNKKRHLIGIFKEKEDAIKAADCTDLR